MVCPRRTAAVAQSPASTRCPPARIGGVQNRAEAAWYVVEKDMDRNVLVVAQGGNNERLLSSKLIASAPSWINRIKPQLPLHCTAKIRYRQDDQSCNISELDSGMIEVEFDSPQRAVTPGQYIVFYTGEHCLGGAIIEKYLN